MARMNATQFQRDAVEAAVRHMLARRQPHFVTRESLRQAGMVAVWRASQTMDCSGSEQQQRSYLYQRALGAMLDARRVETQGPRDGDPIISTTSDGELHDPRVDLDTPEAMYAVRQACEAIGRMPAQLRTVAHLSIAGSSVQHIASVLNVSVSRVSQLRARLAEKLAVYLETTAWTR